MHRSSILSILLIFSVLFGSWRPVHGEPPCRLPQPPDSTALEADPFLDMLVETPAQPGKFHTSSDRYIAARKPVGLTGPGYAHECQLPQEEAPFLCAVLEFGPTILTKPNEPLAHLFSRIFCSEHDVPKMALEQNAIGLQPIPCRPPLLLELNERFLAPGFLAQGIELPTEAVWRPSLWVFGQYRTAIQYFENQLPGQPIMELANRLDLFGQLNLSGTERVLVGVRPLDQELGFRRDFTSYDFRNGNSIDGWNSDIQTLFFEGDFGEVLPFLDPYDLRFLDYGFSVGRMPILAQQGFLINEDMIDALTVTRNTLSGHGNLNLRVTGVFAWDSINRNSPTLASNDFSNTSKMVGLLTESDYYKSTINLDAVYVYDENMFGDVLAVGASAIQRHHGYYNTYNTSLHVLASFPTNGTTPYAQQGELLFAQTSWTPHHTDDLIYLNAFWAIDQYTSPVRGPLMGGTLGQTGLTFAATGVGRYAAPIGVQANDLVGASLGYQLFFDDTRTQVIWEIGGAKETQGTDSRGAIGTVLRYQKAWGQNFICQFDTFVAKREGFGLSNGARTELLVRF